MNSVVMQADNLNFSERDLATINRKVILTLWNVHNYFITYANKNQFKYQISKIKNTIQNSKSILDQWTLARLQELINGVTKHLDTYDTVKATREIERFINDLSTWYLRRSRGRTNDTFFATMYRSLIRTAKILAPVAPYISEIIYQNLHDVHHAESVHLGDWPETKELSKKEQELLAQMAELRKVVEQAHALRAKAGIKLRQPLRRLVIPASEPGSSPRSSPRTGLDSVLVETGIKPGNDRFSAGLLDILKDEVNVKEIIFGDKLELDIVLDDSLKFEGLARELERQINQFRKESGLKIGETVDLYYQTSSDIMRSAFAKVDYKKIYSALVSETKEKLKMDHEKEIEIEGEKIWIGLKIK